VKLIIIILFRLSGSELMVMNKIAWDSYLFSQPERDFCFGQLENS